MLFGFVLYFVTDKTSRHHSRNDVGFIGYYVNIISL